MEQDVVTDLKKLWQTTLTDLQEQMVPTNFTRWVARTSLLSHEAGTAVVGVPDQISAEQLAKRFDPLVRRALADACGESVTVQYQVVEG
jgi:chromosomal replication initiation ATPase DnaA